MIKFLVSINSQ